MSILKNSHYPFWNLKDHFSGSRFCFLFCNETPELFFKVALKCQSHSQNENTTAKRKTQQQITKHNQNIEKHDSSKTKTQPQKQQTQLQKQKHNK